MTRSYTPVPVAYVPSGDSVYNDEVRLDFLVKAYETGNVSAYLTKATPLAESLCLSHPKGNFSLAKIRNHNRIVLLAAGSGITPMLSILDYIRQRTSNKL